MAESGMDGRLFEDRDSAPSAQCGDTIVQYNVNVISLSCPVVTLKLDYEPKHISSFKAALQCLFLFNPLTVKHIL